MLEKVKTALLLTDVPSFEANYRELAARAEVKMTSVSKWSKMYRVTDDVVILGSKFLDSLNEMYYQSAVIILKEGEKPFPFIQKGINRFIFDFRNKDELLLAFYIQQSLSVQDMNADYVDIISRSTAVSFCFGDYDFSFPDEKFKWKGRVMYLTPAEKKYIAQWLLLGKKDNKKRMILFNIRKRVGKTFLADIDRRGQLIEGGKNE